jgi:hypothetical protein
MKINDFFTESDDRDFEKAFASYAKKKELEKQRDEKLAKASPFAKGFMGARQAVKKASYSPLAQTAKRLWKGQVFSK